MERNATIAVTGAAGFIASYLVGHLNALGYERLILVDDFARPEKAENLAGKKFAQQIDREEFIGWWKANPGQIQHVFHLGARTDTTEMDYEVHRKWNLEYSKRVWEQCVAERVSLGIRFVCCHIRRRRARIQR